jgi:actin beta/gamma 1
MEVSTLVIDNGAYTIRAGVGGQEEPDYIIPSIVGRPKSVQGNAIRDAIIAGDVLGQSASLTLKCPIENRIITNFDDITKIWGHLFNNALKVDPAEHPVLMTESPQNTRQARESMVEILMEKFKVPAFYCTCPEILSLYSAGLTTGTVIDSGETVTDILPVFECFAMTHVQTRLEIGGRQLNGFLKKLLMQSGIDLEQANEPDILRDIKEKHCYVAMDLDAEFQKIEHVNQLERQFPLPSGQSIRLTAQRFRCPEPFFDPQLIPDQSPGLPQLILDSINRTEDLKPQMLESVLLTGGSSMFQGLPERIERDLTRMAGPDAKVKVIAPPNRKDSAWIGGSILVSLATFSQMWVTKAEYDETGSSIVHLKCF